MRGVRLHLLVVDDHDAYRELMALRLRALGFRCTAVGSVTAAIEALERERFDSVLSDYSMPGPSGLDLLAYVRRRWPELPFSIMTSFLEEDLRRELLPWGRAAHTKSQTSSTRSRRSFRRQICTRREPAVLSC